MKRVIKAQALRAIAGPFWLCFFNGINERNNDIIIYRKEHTLQGVADEKFKEKMVFSVLLILIIMTFGAQGVGFGTTEEMPPAIYALKLRGINAGDDRMYRAEDVMKRFNEVIDSYDSLIEEYEEDKVA